MSGASDEQRARFGSPTANKLRAILERAHEEHTAVAIDHAIRGGDVSELVASSAASDYALDALSYFVAHGRFAGAPSARPDTSPLHERCRLARVRVDEQVRAALGAVEVGS